MVMVVVVVEATVNSHHHWMRIRLKETATVMMTTIWCALKPLPTPQEATVIKHVLTGWVKRPVVPLTRIPRLARYLHEAVIQAEVMSDAVLPGGETLAVVQELLDDELADFAQRQSFVRRLNDRHRDERDIAVRRLHQVALLLTSCRLLPGGAVVVAVCRRAIELLVASDVTLVVRVHIGRYINFLIVVVVVIVLKVAFDVNERVVVVVDVVVAAVRTPR